MFAQNSEFVRTHMCGEINENLLNQNVTVMGWVNKKRNLGQLLFIALRDITGLVQVIFDENTCDYNIFEKTSDIRGEFVISIKGTVCLRSEKDINPSMKTGKIEIKANDIFIFSKSDVPPFTPSDQSVNEELKLTYRYIDLRRSQLQSNLILRHKVALCVRNFLNSQDFLEIETPLLTKSTPEGARDYLVPSRLFNGEFYALPQSPQIFKQLLMLSGFDKYFQIAKCFRDEDLRADRQPEFTQIDIEMSFCNVDQIMNVTELLMKDIFEKCLNIKLDTPFNKMTYFEAIENYGLDKPDLRFDMKIVDLTDLLQNVDFEIFQNVINTGGSIRALNVTGLASIPRKKIDYFTNFVKDYKAKGLSYICFLEDGTIKTSLSKFLSDLQIKSILEKMNSKQGDLILICSDAKKIVLDALGNLRNDIAKNYNFIDKTKNPFNFVWIIDFPLFEWDDDRFYSKHHPFTAPLNYELDNIEPSNLLSQAYDLVLNGYEIGGGSIRIHQSILQQKVFDILGLSEEDINTKFGFLLEAFKYGAPPHGGLALGLDRIIMILTDASSIRDVIAFPKSKDASCKMTQAPNIVNKSQLDELGIKF